MPNMLASADLGGGVGIFFIRSTHVRVSVMSRYSELTVHLSSIILHELVLFDSEVKLAYNNVVCL